MSKLQFTGTEVPYPTKHIWLLMWWLDPAAEIKGFKYRSSQRVTWRHWHLSAFWPRIRRTLLKLRKQVSVNCCLRADIIWHIWINMYVKENRKALEQRTGERYYGRTLKSHGWQDIFSTHKRNILSFLWTLDTGKKIAKDKHLSGTGRIYGKN